MTKETDANRAAWAKLAEAHYAHYRQQLSQRHSLLNRIITAELGPVAGKRVIHLQCNTGADTVSLARLGAQVTGVDIVPDNVAYARLLAAECGVPAARFVVSDVMELKDTHHERYDIVFTSEGAIGWLPDLKVWAETIAGLLSEGGFFYAFDSHPFQLIFNEETMRDGRLDLRYPYFSREPDRSETIGGYASEPARAENYFWNYTVADLVNSLIAAGLTLDFFHEHDVLYFDIGGMQEVEPGLYRYPFHKGALPYSFSLRATLR